MISLSKLIHSTRNGKKLKCPALWVDGDMADRDLFLSLLNSSDTARKLFLLSGHRICVACREQEERGVNVITDEKTNSRFKAQNFAWRNS